MKSLIMLLATILFACVLLQAQQLNNVPQIRRSSNQVARLQGSANPAANDNNESNPYVADQGPVFEARMPLSTAPSSQDVENLFARARKSACDSQGIQLCDQTTTRNLSAQITLFQPSDTIGWPSASSTGIGVAPMGPKSVTKEDFQRNAGNGKVQEAILSVDRYHPGILPAGTTKQVIEKLKAGDFMVKGYPENKAYGCEFYDFGTVGVWNHGKPFCFTDAQLREYNLAVVNVVDPVSGAQFAVVIFGGCYNVLLPAQYLVVKVKVLPPPPPEKPITKTTPVSYQPKPQPVIPEQEPSPDICGISHKDNPIRLAAGIAIKVNAPTGFSITALDARFNSEDGETVGHSHLYNFGGRASSTGMVTEAPEGLVVAVFDLLSTDGLGVEGICEQWFLVSPEYRQQFVDRRVYELNVVVLEERVERVRREHREHPEHREHREHREHQRLAPKTTGTPGGRGGNSATSASSRSAMSRMGGNTNSQQRSFQQQGRQGQASNRGASSSRGGGMNVSRGGSTGGRGGRGH